MKRSTMISALTATASVTALTVALAAPSQAFTQKELAMCWTNEAIGSLDIEWVADGPSYRAASLDANECVAWDVRPGTYKITLEDWKAVQSGGVSCASKTQTIDSGITVKRMGESYNVPLTALEKNFEFFTDVKKDRRTTITIWARCVPT